MVAISVKQPWQIQMNKQNETEIKGNETKTQQASYDT